MKNITVSIDEETHRLARIRAAELGTSLSALVRGYLKAVVREQADGTEASEQGVETEVERRLLKGVFEDICATRSGFKASDNLPRESLYDRNAFR